MFYGYRPFTGLANPQMPISLKALGYSILQRGNEETNTGINRNHCGIFIAESGEACFTIASKKYNLHAGEALIYYPFESHHLKVTSLNFSYGWFTFDGKATQEILKSYQFSREPFQIGAVPLELLRQAQENFLSFSPEARFNDAVYALKLLEYIAGHRTKVISAEKTSPILRRFRELVEQNYSDCKFNVDKVAAMLGCHRGTLTRIIKESLAITPSSYIENIRINMALNMLKNSAYTAAEIGLACGFATPEYFSRRVKEITGKPPRKLRLQQK